MRDTNIKLKREYLPLFVKLMQEQLMKGAQKYANNEKREFTDIICNAVGAKQFILGTIMKYCGRILNDDPRQAEDIVKIATYAYLLWLKLYSEKEEEKNIDKSEKFIPLEDVMKKIREDNKLDKTWWDSNPPTYQGSEYIRIMNELVNGMITKDKITAGNLPEEQSAEIKDNLSQLNKRAYLVVERTYFNGRQSYQILKTKNIKSDLPKEYLRDFPYFHSDVSFSVRFYETSRPNAFKGWQRGVLGRDQRNNPFAFADGWIYYKEDFYELLITLKWAGGRLQKILGHSKLSDDDIRVEAIKDVTEFARVESFRKHSWNGIIVVDI
jgi:hypothetical protein